MNTIKRTFNIGSEWVYFKIYTGPKTADLLLTELIKPVAEGLLANKHIDKWFFIRYDDPKFHLRVRFRAIDRESIGEIINSFSTPAEYYIEEDMISKIQIDTYQREIERYGENTMEASETIFYRDSEMITSMLDLIDDSDEGEELRWLFAIKSIDAFLNNFKPSEEGKLLLIEQMKIHFCEEFSMNRFLKKQLDKKFIANKEKIEAFIKIDFNQKHELATLINTIQIKSQFCTNTIQQITTQIEIEQLSDFLASHIHMIMNRLFRHKNRLYEMVIYYFLFKYYKSTIGKRKHKPMLNAG